MLKVTLFFHYTEKFLGRGLYGDSSYQHWVGCHFSAPNFLLHKQTQAKGPLCLLMDDDRPLGPCHGYCDPLLNKLASKIGVAYMPALVFLIVIIVALSLLVHTTTVLSKHQEIIKILVRKMRI
ncbi:DUF2304 domain-containing protein [Paenibacillus larvae]|nr:DUF2304 domain-containing protein [Paenibacillus larvae]MDT2260686.1 DUF2304 domain-containing protein [Paenibacillus larvae]